MEAESSIKTKKEDITQEEFDKLTINFLPKLKSREIVGDYMYVWRMKNYEEKKRDRIDPTLFDFLNLTLEDVDNYLAAYCRGFVDKNAAYCRGYVQLDQTTKEEIANEIKLWQEFGDLCTAETDAFKEIVDNVIFLKTNAYFCKLHKIEGVIDKVKNDPTLGDSDEGTMRFQIQRDLINFEEWYDEQDASAKYNGENYEDLIKELVDLLSNNDWSDIAHLLNHFSAFGSVIGSVLKEVLDQV